MDYSRPIAVAIQAFLDEGEYRYDFDAEDGIFMFGIQIPSKLRNIRVIVDVKESFFVVYVIPGIGADPEDKEILIRVMEFLCRANYGLLFGNFEIDVRDGEIRYKNCVECGTPDGVPPAEILERGLFAPIAMVQRYGDGILEMMYGDATPEEAIEALEGD